MEAKKTVKIVLILIIAAVAIFSLILFLNNHIESKEQAVAPKEDDISLSGNPQSYVAANMPVATDDDFISGKNGSLPVIVYEDYSDIFSADFAASLEQASLDFGNKLQVIYRPFNFGHTDLAANAAIAVRCAVDQGRGELFRNKVFQAVRANKLNGENLVSLAEELGLKIDDFKGCLTNPEKKERMEKLSAQASDFSVYGAPTVFVGEEMIVGARPYNSFTDSNGDEIEGLKQVIERQLK